MKKKYIWTCDYCGEEYDTKHDCDKHELNCSQNLSNKKHLITNFKSTFVVYWLTALTTFFIEIVILTKLSDHHVDFSSEQNILILWLANILLGVVFFIFIPFSSNKKSSSLIVRNVFSIAIIYFFTNTIVYAYAGYFSKEYVHNTVTPTINTSLLSNTAPITFISPTPTTKPKTVVGSANQTQNSLECIGPDGKHFNTTMTECEKLNKSWNKPVDYMVNCTYPSECGGGVKREPKSECDKPCTRVNNNSNPQVIYVPQNTTNTNKTAVFLTYGKYTVYCPAQNVGAVMTIDSTMNSKSAEWAKNYNTCTDTFFNSDSCYLSCKDTNKSELNACYALYGYSGTESEACTKPAWDNYSTCISKCPLAPCDWVYSEQKSLTSQIEILCK